MSSPRLFVCGTGAKAPYESAFRDFRTVVLNTEGDDANVNIQFDDVSRVLASNISDRLLDLLEIASYIYTADCSVSRGRGWIDKGAIEKWDRRFHFVIAVRDLAFWKDEQVIALLTQLVSFLSNDECSFEFVSSESDASKQLYFDMQDKPIPETDKVIMFSGGLDSLAGAVELASNGENLILVSHRPVSTMDKRQKDLVKLLRKEFSQQIMHIPVWINKNRKHGDEPSQRTRSFLFSALGTLVATAANLRKVCFFENGVLSLNLPLAEEILRARASRTTHPASLKLLENLSALVVGEEFSLLNPFVFKTKTEVVSAISSYEKANLISYTKSCSHTIHASKTQWHCGTCSQCIDRRIAILAAGQEAHDSINDYSADVITGPRKDGYEKNIAIAYCRHANELQKMSSEEISTRFSSELARATRPFAQRTQSAEEFIAMHERHASSVCSVLESQIKLHSSSIAAGTLDKSSLLALITSGSHTEPLFRRFYERVSGIFRKGIPPACRSKKPDREARLQELCEGILKSADAKLAREFPFVRWSFAHTKPDFSSEYFGIWIEIKYVRQSQGPAKITDDIASDLTKYGDSGARVLFVIYDPERLITDDDEFLEPILRREQMGATIIR